MEGRPQLVARALLIHLSPIYWGEVTGPVVQMLLRTFKLTSKESFRFKEKMMAIQSNVLKG